MRRTEKPPMYMRDEPAEAETPGDEAVAGKCIQLAEADSHLPRATIPARTSLRNPLNMSGVWTPACGNEDPRRLPEQ